MILKRALRIISALLSIYFFSELFTEIKATDTNVLLSLVHLISGSYLVFYTIFGSRSILSILSNRKIVSFDLSDEILDIADKAISIAENWSHSSVKIEHLLLALLKDDEVALIINECGGKIKEISDSINDYFEKELEKNKDHEESEIKISDELRHTFRNAIKRAISSSQNPKELSSGYILASLLETENTFPYKLLNENNISRFKILKWLAHKDTEIRGFRTIERIPAQDTDGIWKVIIYNDDFTTMEFVYSLLISLFNKSKKHASEIVLNIHKKGFSTCGEYEFIEAVNKMNKVHELSSDNEFPLMCSIEKHGQE